MSLTSMNVLLHTTKSPALAGDFVDLRCTVCKTHLTLPLHCKAMDRPDPPTECISDINRRLLERKLMTFHDFASRKNGKAQVFCLTGEKEKAYCRVIEAPTCESFWAPTGASCWRSACSSRDKHRTSILG